MTRQIHEKSKPLDCLHLSGTKILFCWSNKLWQFGNDVRNVRINAKRSYMKSYRNQERTLKKLVMSNIVIKKKNIIMFVWC